MSLFQKFLAARFYETACQTSLLQLFGFFQSAFFMAEQRFFPSLPLPDIPTRR
jgi:hypothetical protein